MFSKFEEQFAIDIKIEIEMEDETFLHVVQFIQGDSTDLSIIIVFVVLIIDIFDGDNDCDQDDSRKN